MKHPHHIAWEEMTPQERIELWKENKDSDHFSKNWTIGMFSRSPAAISAALARREQQ